MIDFDAAIRDPLDPQCMLPETDTGDHLHPNNTGFSRMAACISLDVLAAVPIK
ncbi:hypothetical protein [Deinococcus roseus]|uniref:SGNH hydrolase-type esterase domain-containing protein n=1 Tax=Deinococcus roseus TaxID=392414 RepID=A0ABQ2CWG0_9DEIO|nr:hypothetical protein [Deinococcus roseus]GGJ27376.1 hypothetical protein GCM10008938_11830 [Deinococcus roseus]